MYFNARYYSGKDGIFLSVDPLLHLSPHQSPFMYCGGNPIKYIDPDGRIQKIAGSDGEEITYEPMMVYTGTDAFIKQAVDALNYGYENSPTTKGTIDNIVNSEYTYTIKKGIESIYVPNSDDYITNNEGMEIREKGGGTIYWDTKGANIFEQKDKTNLITSVLARRPIIDLFHELGHVDDHISSLLYHRKHKIKDLELVEWQATHRENKIRSELNLPLRTYYGTNQYEDGSKGPRSPRLIRQVGNEIRSNYDNSVLYKPKK